MTDNEIIKALECCTAGGEGCNGCPLNDMPMDCIKSLVGYAPDLIKRQQAEIKRLWEDCDYFEDKVKTIKSEAITEFAEKLKDYAWYYVVDMPAINRLEKEMLEGI